MNPVARFLMVLVLVGAGLSASGQETAPPQPEERHAVLATGRVLDRGIELRWYPGSAGIWRHANQHGYLLERMEISEAGERAGWQRLGGGVLKPWTAEEWLRLADATNDYVRAASRAILEPTVPPAANVPFDAWKEYRDQENGIFLFFTLATNLHPDAARGAALRYLDTAIEPGKGYVYRISVPTWKGELDVRYGMVVVENSSAMYEAPAVTGVRVEELEGAVRVFWPSDPNEALFPTFHVERSADGTQWQRLNRLPIFFGSPDAQEFFYTDSIANYKPHWYRVTGISPFADAGRPSGAIRAMARDLTPPAGAANTRAEGDRKSIKVTWELPKPSSDMAGFLVGRGEQSDGPFAILHEKPLAPGTRAFTDNAPLVMEPFYIVWSVDTAGNRGHAVAVMAFVKDNEPPARPVGLSGYCDSMGVVRLTWTANTEEDLAGYHVLTANGINDVYRPLTGRPVQRTEWTDTVDMRALNRPIYYKVTAVDYNNNPSGYSDVLEVLRPDLIPPAAPVITRYRVEEGVVVLDWHLSPSQDVVGHILEREEAATGTRSTLLRIEKQPLRSFRDDEAIPGSAYLYRVIATDAAGLTAASDPLEVSVPVRSTRPGVHNLRIAKDDSGSQVMLSWEYSEPGGDHRFVIFRREEGGEARTYRSLAAGQHRFQDEVRGDTPRQYAIKVIFPSGAESALSEWVSY